MDEDDLSLALAIERFLDEWHEIEGDGHRPFSDLPCAKYIALQLKKYGWVRDES